MGSEDQSSYRFAWFWGFGSALFLAAGAIIPFQRIYRLGLPLGDYSWMFVDETPITLRLCLLVPLFVAGTIPATLLILRERSAPWVLGTGLGSLVLYFAFTLVGMSRSFGSISAAVMMETVLRIQLIVGAALVAAGNHALRRHAGRAAPRILIGSGGAFLLAAFLVPTGDSWSGPLAHEVIFEAYRSPEWLPIWFAALLLAFGVTAVVTAMARRPPVLRCRLLRVGAYVLLAIFPLTVLHAWWGSSYNHWYSGRSGTWHELPGAAKFWLLATGHTVLLATGIASVVDRALSRTTPQAPAPAMLTQA